MQPSSTSSAFPRLLAAAGALVAVARLVGRRPGSSAATRKHVSGDLPLQVPLAGAVPIPGVAAAATGPGMLSGERWPLQGKRLFAVRGSKKSESTGRGAKIVANAPRHPLGPYAKMRKQQMWLDYSKNFTGRQRNCYRLAQPMVIKALKQRVRSRRLFKRDRRGLWIMRVNANCKLHGIRYSEFIRDLKEKNININRKILSQLGIYDRAVFTNIMNVSTPNWRKTKKKLEKAPKQWTVKEIDKVTIPYIEKCVPELYTDATIRFNRQVKDWGVEYTVDMGEPEAWREILPQMPELANFNLPDHWMGNANAEFEGMPIELLTVPKDQEHPDYYKFMEKVKAAQEEDKEKEARGEPTWPKKEGVDRKDWFKDEPQSWY